VAAIDETDSQSWYNVIIWWNLQQAMGVDILFFSKKFRWDGIENPMQIKNSNFIDLGKKIKQTETL
jgi:hypothetical protein